MTIGPDAHDEAAPATPSLRSRLVNVDAIVTQTVLYGASILAGLQLSLVRKLPTQLERDLGNTASIAWLALAIIAPVLVIGASLFPANYRANYASLAGCIGMVTVFAVYILALVDNSLHGQVSYAVWIFGALALLSICFGVRDVVRIRQNNAIAKALRRRRAIEAGE